MKVRNAISGEWGLLSAIKPDSRIQYTFLYRNPMDKVRILGEMLLLNISEKVIRLKELPPGTAHTRRRGERRVLVSEEEYFRVIRRMNSNDGSTAVTFSSL